MTPRASTLPAHMHACAHRGDSSRYRENTLPAIRSAIAEGADFVEVDVRVSADAAVVVVHDPSAERLWGRSAEIAELTWAELRELGDGDNRIPLLSDVLELFTDSTATLLIDMEEAYPAEPAYRVTAGSGAKAAWCGDLDGMRTIRALDPEATIWMPWDAASAPTVADIEELSPEYVNSEYLTMTRAMVGDIHSLGCKVAVWTVDDEATMRRARGIGVDSVTTNQLSRLQGIIIEEPSGGRVPDGPMPAEPDLDAVREVARELAQWAIDFARTSDPGEISTKKNPADLVTEVDVAVERHVREVVGDRFPGYGFVGEELGGKAEAGVPCWYLDPVDGTTNFANRIPWNAFSLALVIDDTPLVGVVADPWRGELFEAMRGGGARLNGERLRLGDENGADDPLAGRVVSTELASYQAWPGMLEMLEALSARYCTMRIMGSGTMTLVGIAAGRGVGSVIGSFGPVDHLAALLIVQEAGGVVKDASGTPNLYPASGGIMAAAPHAADALYDLWQAAVTAHRQ